MPARSWNNAQRGTWSLPQPIKAGKLPYDLKRSVWRKTQQNYTFKHKSLINLIFTARRIYWTDGNLDKIYHSDYDGNGRQTLLEVPKGSRLMDLEMLGNYLYYVAMDNQYVWQHDLYL